MCYKTSKTIREVERMFWGVRERRKLRYLKKSGHRLKKRNSKILESTNEFKKLARKDKQKYNDHL